MFLLTIVIILFYRNFPPSNVTYNQEAVGNNPYHQEYHQNNIFSNIQNLSNQQNEGDAWNQAWGDEDNFNINTQTQQRDITQTNYSHKTGIRKVNILVICVTHDYFYYRG